MAARVLGQVRRWPALHGLVHGAAVVLIRTAWGERFVRSVTAAEAMSDAEYRTWIRRYDTLSDADRAAIRAHVAKMPAPPTISVIMPAYATPPALLEASIRSVRDQLYPHWELCVADDASPDPAVWSRLQQMAAEEPRLRIVRRAVNGQISAATNSALALATGAFVAFLDHDDLLAEHALYMVAAELEAHPDADMIFSDEDKIDEGGQRSQPHLKTAYDPELMTGQNMVNHLTAIRRTRVAAAGGLREGYDGAQDHDLVLRIAETTPHARIRHIPYVLYHWRWQGEQGSYSRDRAEQCAAAAQRAVADHIARSGSAAAATVEQLPGGAGWLRVRRPLPSPAPRVTVIVPTRDRADLLARCAEGVLSRTDYPALDLLIVDNGSVEPQTRSLLARLSEDARVKVMHDARAFNYAALMNAAVEAARGAVVVLLNNDVEVRDRGWLAELVSQAARPDVGAVGAKLLFPDGSIQHAGVVLGVGEVGVAGHLYAGARPGHVGYQGCLMLAREVSAVTAACLAMRRSVYLEVGGMDAAALAVAYNDVDLCLKLRSAGYRIIWTPFAELTHAESASRGSDQLGAAARRFAAEAKVMRARWGQVLDNDPFYGRVFDRAHVTFKLAEPPVRAQPWARPRD